MISIGYKGRIMKVTENGSREYKREFECLQTIGLVFPEILCWSWYLLMNNDGNKARGFEFPP